ncbi:MAG TPA: hypothetical protein VFC75_02450 [Erysipelothrix sp.]|nr:hypothetical protein [Erysipelothrix sp.]
MKVEHIHLDEMYRAYAAANFEVDNETCIFIASEEEGYPCIMYSGDKFENKTTVWEKGGGCMSIIPIPNKKNEFLAIMDFYLKESPSRAKLVWGKYKDGKWDIEDVLYLPYLHRFDIYHLDNKNYFVGATIADEKEYKDDWRKPGSIYVGEIPDTPTEGIKLKKIAGDLFRNHGYYRYEDENGIRGYFTSDEGIFELNPHNNWELTQILEGPIGEVAVMDINGDGHNELITIEPFHGDEIKIYEKKNDQYEVVYEFPYELNFGHTLEADLIHGVPTFVGGIRRVGNQLFTIQYLNDEYHLEILDDGGPSNVSIGHKDDYDFIVGANHTRNEAAVYLLHKE